MPESHSDSRLQNVVHLVNPYLFHTGSWIYSQLVTLTGYNNIVFTQEKTNLELFPFKEVYCPRDFGYLSFIFSQIYGQLSGRHGLRFGNLVQRVRPCLFHAHFGDEAFRWLSFVRRVGRPLITSFYGYDVSKLGKIPRWRERYSHLFEYGAVFLAEGPYLKRQLVQLGCPEGKVVVQHLGVSVAKYSTVSKHRRLHDGRTIVLQVSSFREKKGIPYSLRAIARCKEQNANIEFRLIGAGDTQAAEQEVVNLVKTLGLSQTVVLLGKLSHEETIKEMQNADIFLHPSVTAADGDNEGGAPVVIIEASAVGLPVVATLHADIPEVIRHGKSGLLAPEKDVDELAAHLCALIMDPGRRSAMGVFGRRHVEKEYDLTKQVRKLEEIYSATAGLPH